jgi:hypothetical protein
MLAGDDGQGHAGIGDTGGGEGQTSFSIDSNSWVF